jgi:hypothetical protein
MWKQRHVWWKRYLYNSFKIRNYFVHLDIGPNTHTLKCRNKDYQYYSNRTQCGLMYGYNGQLPGGPTSISHANLCKLCCIRHNFEFLNTDFVGSINTRNICLILSTIYSFISVSFCIDRGLSALLWPGPILLIRRSWPYVIHHLHFMNMYRLYIACYRPILLMYVVA